VSCVVSIAVLGATGFAGAIAAQLLYRHPDFELAHVTARAEAGQRLDDVHPRTRVPLELERYEADRHGGVEAAVVAYPHAAAAPVVAELRERGVRVVDLSADFRLRDRGIYEDWYGEHKAPQLFGSGVYGLPELARERVREADLVANPGCYPTATLLALAPLARAGLIGDVIVDAKSGVSGAGRGATDFIAADENVSPYKIAGHRHTPEIEQELAALGAGVTITFMPHLLPLAQGELVSCYVTPAREPGEGELEALFDDAYASEPFVELRSGPVGVLEVRDSNYCRISFHHDPRTGRVIVFAALDNLWKGAASQAVQNLNLMFGHAEGEGLR
jgi:N-acetyl-gamma-glutamyl-phosphate reductase